MEIAQIIDDALYQYYVVKQGKEVPNWRYIKDSDLKICKMNLLLRPLDNANDPVWSVIISLVILLAGVMWYIVYIMRMAFDELEDE